jgi:pentatricopeptide repeat protein
LIFRDVRLDDPAVFHGVIQAWGMSGRGRGAAMEAERIVHDVMPKHGCRPNGQTYALLVAAWTEVERLERTGDAATWAEMLLQDFLMVQYRRQPQQQMRSIDIVADAFTTCITAWMWAAPHHPDAPARAEALYQQLLQLLQQETEVKLDHQDDAPSSASSHDDNGMKEKWVVAAENALLSTWARCSSHLRPDAINDMQQHFSSMKYPNLASYNIMLDGYARRGMRREARDLFDTMKKHDRRDLRPDLATYNTLLKAMVHATDTQRDDFETVLFEMEDVLSPIAPDKVTYTRKCPTIVMLISNPTSDEPYILLHSHHGSVGQVFGSRKA